MLCRVSAARVGWWSISWRRVCRRGIRWRWRVVRWRRGDVDRCWRWVVDVNIGWSWNIVGQWNYNGLRWRVDWREWRWSWWHLLEHFFQLFKAATILSRCLLHLLSSGRSLLQLAEVFSQKAKKDRHDQQLHDCTLFEIELKFKLLYFQIVDATTSALRAVLAELQK